MTLLILTSLIVAVAATSRLASRPLFLGTWVLILTLVIRLIANLLLSSWLGIIIILIYVGGLLVIFAYFVALTPNLIIEGKTILVNLIASTPVFFIFLITLNIADIKTLSYNSLQPITYLFIEHISIISILALILFFALVATVKLVRNSSSPLRPFN